MDIDNSEVAQLESYAQKSLGLLGFDSSSEWFVIIPSPYTLESLQKEYDLTYYQMKSVIKKSEARLNMEALKDQQHVEGQITVYSGKTFHFDLQNMKLGDLNILRRVDYMSLTILLVDGFLLTPEETDAFIALLEDEPRGTIDWENANEYVFSDGSVKSPGTLVPFISEEFLDEFPDDGSVGFGDVFERMDEFKNADYEGFYTCVCSNHIGAIKRRWIKNDERLEYFFANEDGLGEHGYTVLYSNGVSFLIVGVLGGHPFIYTNEFEYNNSHGSTSEDEFDYNMTLSEIIDAVKKAAHEYLE
jgi:hypothetical protein